MINGKILRYRWYDWPENTPHDGEINLTNFRVVAALMAGIVMDTSTFAHPNSTPRTLAVAAALVAAGAPLSDISRRLYRSKPDGQLRLFGRVLDRLEVTDGGRVIHSWLGDADLAATGTLGAHSEGLIDLLAQSETAEVAILFKEAGPTSTRLSVRTKPGGVDATVLTGAFTPFDLTSGGSGTSRTLVLTQEPALNTQLQRVVDAHEARLHLPLEAEVGPLVRDIGHLEQRVIRQFALLLGLG